MAVVMVGAAAPEPYRRPITIINTSTGTTTNTYGAYIEYGAPSHSFDWLRRQQAAPRAALWDENTIEGEVAD